jgi:hypothetical protein
MDSRAFLYISLDRLTLSRPVGYICSTFKESFQVRWDNSIPLFLHAAIYLEVSLFRWTSQNAFSHETSVYKWYCVQCCMQHCAQYHLQYDRFRTTLNKNWRELMGNNFTDHVRNTCSDDSRSCDFIVVWELRLSLRVLPTFEDGHLIYSWKKVKFQAITVTRKLELSWKFLYHFRIQRTQNSKVYLVSFP